MSSRFFANCWTLIGNHSENYGHHWSIRTKRLRDKEYDYLRLHYKSHAKSLTLRLTKYLQPTIDKIQESVIRHDEVGQAAVRDQDDELTRLRERVAKLKEYTP